MQKSVYLKSAIMLIATLGLSVAVLMPSYESERLAGRTPTASEAAEVTTESPGNLISYSLMERATVRVFLKYMVQASGEEPDIKLKLFDEATDYLRKYWAQPIVVQHVATAEELMSLQKSIPEFDPVFTHYIAFNRRLFIARRIFS